MSDQKIVELRNGGVPRRLTFAIMRDCRTWIVMDSHAQPTEIRCNHYTMTMYAELFPEYKLMRWQAAGHKGCVFDGIPMLECASIPSGELWWYRDDSGRQRVGENARLVGVIADLCGAP
jgi:hypothetical protein